MLLITDCRPGLWAQALTQQHLLGHDGRQAAQEMASAIQHQDLLKTGGLSHPELSDSHPKQPLFAVSDTLTPRVPPIRAPGLGPQAHFTDEAKIANG